MSCRRTDVKSNRYLAHCLDVATDGRSPVGTGGDRPVWSWHDAAVKPDVCTPGTYGGCTGGRSCVPPAVCLYRRPRGMPCDSLSEALDVVPYGHTCGLSCVWQRDGQPTKRRRSTRRSDVIAPYGRSRVARGGHPSIARMLSDVAPVTNPSRCPVNRPDIAVHSAFLDIHGYVGSIGARAPRYLLFVCGSRGPQACQDSPRDAPRVAVVFVRRRAAAAPWQMSARAVHAAVGVASPHGV